MIDSQSGNKSLYSWPSPSFHPARDGIRALLNLGISPLHDDRIDYGIEDLTGRVDRGRYVGSGSSGDVYQGVWCGDGDKTNLPPIAVKVFRVCGSVDTKTQKKRYSLLRREYEVWKGLSHKNILPFVGIATLSETLPAIVSIFMEKGTIRAFLQENQDVQTLPFLQDIAEGVNYLHQFTPAIIHGDLKGDNVLVNEFGIAVICDFGFSQMVLEDTTLLATSAESSLDSFRWKAPELIDPFTSENTVSKESDIYSYAITSWEILSRNMPFPDLNDGAVLFAVLQDDARPEKPTSLSQDDPLWLLWQNCWHRDPKERLSASMVVEYMSAIPEATRSSIGTPVGDRPVEPGSSASAVPLAGADQPASYSATSDNYSLHASSENDGRTVDSYFVQDTNSTAPTEPDLAPQFMSSTEKSKAERQRQLRAASLLSEDVEYSRHGEIVSGSFEGLFHCFISGSDCFRRNPTLQTAFITCSPTFAPPSRLATAFQHVLNGILLNNERPENNLFRESVLQIMCRWLSCQRSLNLTPGLIHDLREFARSAATNTLSHGSEVPARELLSIIEAKKWKLEAAQTYNAAHSSKLHDAADPAIKSPVELATALTIIARDFYRDTTPHDLIHWLADIVPGKDVICCQVVFARKLVRWTIGQILFLENQKSRIAALEMFIKTAKECLRLNNYVSAAALLKACSSSMITDLKGTYGHMHHSAQKDLRNLCHFMGKPPDFAPYRNKISEHAASFHGGQNRNQDGQEVIPNLFSHLEELKAIWGQHEAYVQVSGEDRINFARCTALSACISGYLQFQGLGRSQVESRREGGVLGYIESQLDLLDSSPQQKARLNDRASQLRYEEEAAYMSRIPETSRGRVTPSPRISSYSVVHCEPASSDGPHPGPPSSLLQRPDGFSKTSFPYTRDTADPKCVYAVTQSILAANGASAHVVTHENAIKSILHHHGIARYCPVVAGFDEIFVKRGVGLLETIYVLVSEELEDAKALCESLRETFLPYPGVILTPTKCHRIKISGPDRTDDEHDTEILKRMKLYSSTQSSPPAELVLSPNMVSYEPIVLHGMPGGWNIEYTGDAGENMNDGDNHNDEDQQGSASRSNVPSNLGQQLSHERAPSATDTEELDQPAVLNEPEDCIRRPGNSDNPEPEPSEGRPTPEPSIYFNCKACVFTGDKSVSTDDDSAAQIFRSIGEVQCYSSSGTLRAGLIPNPRIDVKFTELAFEGLSRSNTASYRQLLTRICVDVHDFDVKITAKPITSPASDGKGKENVTVTRGSTNSGSISAGWRMVPTVLANLAHTRSRETSVSKEQVRNDSEVIMYRMDEYVYWVLHVDDHNYRKTGLNLAETPDKLPNAEFKFFRDAAELPAHVDIEVESFWSLLSGLESPKDLLKLQKRKLLNVSHWVQLKVPSNLSEPSHQKPILAAKVCTGGSSSMLQETSNQGVHLRSGVGDVSNARMGNVREGRLGWLPSS